MRITRLALARYGHLSDVDLSFDPDVGLHVVLGANEAGKSTALAAVADALFGFPHRTPFAFQHDTRDLRVGIGVQAASGASRYFVRLKRRQEALLDEHDDPVAESALAGFLGGAGRERFTELFGMDGSELRRGGLAILRGEGEVGQSIVQAHTGLHDVRAAASRLNDEAAALYGSRRGSRSFHTAVEAFHAARRELDDREVRPAQHAAALAELDRCRRARDENDARAARLDVEHARLHRVRATTPFRLALLRDLALRDAFGEVASLPEDAELRRREAVQAREVARRERGRAAEAQARDEAEMAALEVDEAILAEAAAIEALAADLNRIEGLRRERETVGLRAEQAQARLEEAGARLGLAPDAGALAARLPDDLVRASAARAITEHTALATRQAGALEALDQARATLEAARAALACLAQPSPADDLIAAIDAARAEGRIDAEKESAESACRGAGDAIARALAALPLWSGSADVLAATPPPLPASVASAEATLHAAEASFADRERELAAHEQQLRAIAADLAGTLAAGTPPTQDAIAAARERRDRAWRLIRRHRIDGGPAPEESELAGLPADLAAALAGLMAAADALVDRQASEAQRLAQYLQLRGSEARTAALRDAAREALALAARDRETARSAWLALWRDSGIAPDAPAAMRDWLGRREAVLSALADARAKEVALAKVRARHEAAWRRLAAVVPEAVDEAAGQVATLLRAAERQRAAWDSAQQTYRGAREAVAAGERAFAGSRRDREKAETKLQTWRDDWAPVAAALGLPPGAGAQSGTDALAIWDDIDRQLSEWRAATQRVTAAAVDIAAFAAAAAQLAARHGEDPDRAPADLVRALAARTAAARAAAAKHADLAGNVAHRAREIAALDAEIARAEDELAGLRALAGVSHDEALAAAIERASKYADLVARIRAAEAGLRRLDDGHSLEELTREAEGVEVEAVPAALDRIRDDRKAINAENETLAVTIRELEQRLRDMERGRDAAEAAERMQDAAAQAQDVAVRYVRLRLGQALLTAGIERYRREQQAPLLGAAGALFARLTEGRYDRLVTSEPDDDNDRIVLVARRPDGGQCPVDRLSEGTRDQLFLALRLAAIGLHAARAEPLPFLADDLLASFDDRRARAALRALAEFGRVTQTILFTHHGHIAELADPATTRVHVLPALEAPRAAA